MENWLALNTWSDAKRTCTLFAVLSLVLSSCSVQSLVTDEVLGSLDFIATYTEESDPLLVEEAMPATLKIIDAFLTNSPDNPDLLITAASAYTMYAHAFVKEEADRMAFRDRRKARELRLRCKRLYLRARDYGLRGFEENHPGIRFELSQKPEIAVQQLSEDDVALIYWTAASWGAALGVDAEDYALLVDLPIIEHLITRALELNEQWGNGRLHEFMISFAASQENGGGSCQTAESHFKRALEINNGGSAGTYVAAAEAIAVRQQDKQWFQELLRKALAVDVDENPSNRLANILAQDRAEWLLHHIDRFFYE